MNTCIFHTVNSGVYLWDGAHGILVDGIHTGPEQGWSLMPKALVTQLESHTGLFAHLDGMVFTHLHEDHFSQAGLNTVLKGTPLMEIYGPNLAETSVVTQSVSGGLTKFIMAGHPVLAKDTVHDGAQFVDAPHQSFFIHVNGETFFFAGDAILTCSDAQGVQDIFEDGVSYAFCNIMQLISPKAHDFLRKLRPKRIFLYHLPTEEEDRFSYRSLIKNVYKSMPLDLPPVELLAHMAWLDGRVASWVNPTAVSPE